MSEVEFFFDCACVWAYFGLAHFNRSVARHGLALRPRPVDMTQVFRTVNQAYLEPQAEVRRRYFAADLREWAHFLNIPLVDPTPEPIPSADCMRACVAAEHQGRLPEFMVATFEALWTQGRDVGDCEVLLDLWAGLGLSKSLLAEELAAPGPRRHLESNTRELMRRGGFGVPTFFFGEQMFFGADSVPLLELAVRRSLRAS